jgi:hypothetical protein
MIKKIKWKVLSLRLGENEIEKLDYLLVKLWSRKEIDTFSRTAVIKYLINSWWEMRDILEKLVKEKLEKVKNEKK